MVARWLPSSGGRRDLPEGRGWLVVQATGSGCGELALGPTDEGVQLPPVVETVEARQGRRRRRAWVDTPAWERSQSARQVPNAFRRSGEGRRSQQHAHSRID